MTGHYRPFEHEMAGSLMFETCRATVLGDITSGSAISVLYDVAVDVPAALPERPAFDTPIERLIEANAASTMNLGATDADGFTRWFEGS